MLPVGNLWDESWKQNSKLSLDFVCSEQNGHQYERNIGGWDVYNGFWLFEGGGLFGVQLWLYLTLQIEAKCNMWMLWQMRHTWQKPEVGENWEARGRFPWGMCVLVYMCVQILRVCEWFTVSENYKSNIIFGGDFREAFLTIISFVRSFLNAAHKSVHNSLMLCNLSHILHQDMGSWSMKLKVVSCCHRAELTELKHFSPEHNFNHEWKANLLVLSAVQLKSVFLQEIAFINHLHILEKIKESTLIIQILWFWLKVHKTVAKSSLLRLPWVSAHCHFNYF